MYVSVQELITVPMDNVMKLSLTNSWQCDHFFVSLFISSAGHFETNLMFWKELFRAPVVMRAMYWLT